MEGIINLIISIDAGVWALIGIILILLTIFIILAGNRFRLYRRLRRGFWVKHDVHYIGGWEPTEDGGWTRYKNVLDYELNKRYSEELAVEDYTSDKHLQK